MAFWILDGWGETIDYPTLGFIAGPGDILEATAAPDPRWSSTGSGPETVTRYPVGSDPSYVEPTDGHVLAWSDVDNAYVPTAPETLDLDSDLNAIAALTTTAYGRALLELANVTALRALFPAASETVSSLVEAATQAETNTGTDDARFVTPLKLATLLAAAYQPLDTDLSAIAALTSAADKLPYATGAGTWSLTDITLAGRLVLAGADGNAIRAQINAGALHRTVNSQTGTSYTLVLTDDDKVIQVSNAATHTLTVPPNSSVAFANGTQVQIDRIGAGAVNIAAGVGVTINSRGGLLGINGQYGSVRLRKRATDTWVLTGDLA